MRSQVAAFRPRLGLRPASWLLPGLLLGALASGCGTVRVEVPAGSDVRLLRDVAPAEVHAQQRAWFWLWGARPLRPEDADVASRLLADAELREARVEVSTSWSDALMALPLGVVSITTRTVAVEGNR